VSDDQATSEATSDTRSAKTKAVQLHGSGAYEVARLAIELRKVPQVVDENPTWGELSFLAICLLELANEQLGERAQLPVKRFFNEPLAYWGIERQRRLDLYDHIHSWVDWQERSNSPPLPFAKVAKQITHSQRTKRAIHYLEQSLSFLAKADSLPDYVRKSAEAWLQHAIVPKEQVEFLSEWYAEFQKLSRSALAREKGRKGGLATAAKSKSKAQRH